MNPIDDATIVQPIRIPWVVWLVAAAALFALYLLTMENGAVLAQGAHTVHEFVHDARHFVGMPCH